jgi:LacI family gluconate utilization system Gnt-I transcriptional repressor
VAPETRARIEAAVASLGYVPNLVAGALASARTRTVGILVPTVASSVFATTINGLTDVLEAEGYSIVLAQSGYEAARELTALAALLGRRPEGIVMVGSPMTDTARAMLAAAVDRGTMVVETWDLPEQPIGSVVGFNNRAVGAAVATRFAAAGRQRLAFVGGNDDRASARFGGFAETAARLGLAPPLRIRLPAPAAMADAVAAYDMASSPEGLLPTDAIFAATDVHAFGLLSAALRHGRRVPEDTALIGLGDLEMARFSIPSLTTVRIDGARMGQATAALILEGAQQPSHDYACAQIDLGFELIVRESG